MVNQEPRKRGAVPTRLLAAKDTSLTPGDPSNNAHTGKGGMEYRGHVRQKANTRESAEGIVGNCAEGPNVGSIAEH